MNSTLILTMYIQHAVLRVYRVFARDYSTQNIILIEYTIFVASQLVCFLLAVSVIHQMELHLTLLGISTAGMLSVICVAIILVIGIRCCMKVSAHKRNHQAHNQQSGEAPIEMHALALMTTHQERSAIREDLQPANTSQDSHTPAVQRPVLPNGFKLWKTFDIGKFECGDASVIKLEIPPGAVAEGVTGHIDIGVAFNGPFQYPRGLVPVSPVFWICVRGQEIFKFQQPVMITVRHCLHLDSCKSTCAQSSGLTFVVAKYSAMTFERPSADYEQTFPSSYTAMLSTRHFCFLCICCDNAIDKIEYSLIQVPAEPHLTEDSHSPTGFFDIVYYITYNLPYCLTTVEDYCAQGSTPEVTEFCFQSQSKEQPFIQVQHAELISGCYISSRAIRDSNVTCPDKKVRVL